MKISFNYNRHLIAMHAIRASLNSYKIVKELKYRVHALRRVYFI
jgi:hypothetical protein